MNAEQTIWSTPQKLYDKLNAEFRFDMDVCADDDNAKCELFWHREIGLERDWRGRCFLNPPYGREIGLWLAKARNEALGGATIVCLVPTRTNAPWWHDYAMQATEIRFIRKKLAFVSDNGKKGVPFTGHAVLAQDEGDKLASETQSGDEERAQGCEGQADRRAGREWDDPLHPERSLDAERERGSGREAVPWLAGRWERDGQLFPALLSGKFSSRKYAPGQVFAETAGRAEKELWS